MDSSSSLFLGVALVALVGSLGFWLVLRHSARDAERRQRDQALAAASLYTPAERLPAYGIEPDPCAPGLTDGERVQAMRDLLLRGDLHSENANPHAVNDAAFAPTQPMEPMEPMDPGPTTSPMAWKPTQPFVDTDAYVQPRTRRFEALDEAGDDREHITI
ncbi:MAG TPA: hypothetical protein PKJ45_10485 [Rubrivivax sp.]|nr:hypothetical protein [Rubrivivax sp.]